MTTTMPLASPVRALFKHAPEDFRVDEIAAYEPSGLGEHVYLTFEKTNLTTQDAVRAIGKALGLQERDIGVAGLKDKVGITTQTISLPKSPRAPDLEARTRELNVRGVRVLLVSLHGNKLKTGHLRGNRFEICLRGIPSSARAQVEAGLAVIRAEGVPNAYGTQRFGREQDNAARAIAWLRGDAPGPREPKAKRFLVSALQSEVFNQVLAERERDGSWCVPQLGDLLERHPQGVFLCEDVTTDRARALTGEVSPTGPMFGPDMRAPTGEIEALEARVTERVLGSNFPFEAAARLGEGTRRSLRVWVEGLADSWSETLVRPDGTDEVSLSLSFVLPRGAYATTVLSRVFDLEEPAPAAKGIDS